MFYIIGSIVFLIGPVTTKPLYLGLFGIFMILIGLAQKLNHLEVQEEYNPFDLHVFYRVENDRGALLYYTENKPDKVEGQQVYREEFAFVSSNPVREEDNEG